MKHPLSRFAPSPSKGDDGLCCRMALAGRPSEMQVRATGN